MGSSGEDDCHRLVQHSHVLPDTGKSRPLREKSRADGKLCYVCSGESAEQATT